MLWNSLSPLSIGSSHKRLLSCYSPFISRIEGELCDYFIFRRKRKFFFTYFWANFILKILGTLFWVLIKFHMQIFLSCLYYQLLLIYWEIIQYASVFSYLKFIFFKFKNVCVYMYMFMLRVYVCVLVESAKWQRSFIFLK